MKTDLELKEACGAQTQYIKMSMSPNFAPSDGICFRCHKNIYQDFIRNGWDLSRASSSLITGCPHCNYSFCD